MYIPTDLLFGIVEKEGLRCEFDALPPGIRGWYCPEERLILINYWVAYIEALFRETLTEEIGHAVTIDNNPYMCDATYYGRIMDNKTERPALIWAVNFLIDTNEFLYLCAQLSDCSAEGMIYQLAEYFGVTPRFVQWKERIIREKGIGWDSFNGTINGWSSLRSGAIG